MGVIVKNIRKRSIRAAASENLAIGDLVYLKSDKTWAKADADGSGTYPTRGIVTRGVSSGGYPEVCEECLMGGFSSLTSGANVYLSTTPGGVTQTAPSTSGNCIQVVGFAISATEISFNFTNYHTLKA